MSARNETLDRSLLHMAWANADVFARLAGLPDASDRKSTRLNSSHT